MITKQRIAAVTTVCALALAACGGSDSTDDTVDTDPPVDTSAVTDPGDDFSEVDDTVADTVAETAPEADTVVDDTVADTVDAGPTSSDATSVGTEPGEVGDASAGGAVTVGLVEWMIEAPTSYVAGEITFTAVNDGGFPHEFVVIEGESYESLPLEEGGAVIEDDLPTGALIGRTARIGGGSSEDLTVTLASGNYVLLCNLGGGSNSHAGQGQRLDITVI